MKGRLWLGWNLQQVSNSGSKDHVVIHVLTERQSLGPFYTTPDQTLMTRTVKNARKDFDGPWQKIALTKEENNAKLFLDC